MCCYSFPHTDKAVAFRVRRGGGACTVVAYSHLDFGRAVGDAHGYFSDCSTRVVRKIVSASCTTRNTSRSILAARSTGSPSMVRTLEVPDFLDVATSSSSQLLKLFWINGDLQPPDLEGA